MEPSGNDPESCVLNIIEQLQSYLHASPSATHYPLYFSPFAIRATREGLFSNFETSPNACDPFPIGIQLGSCGFIKPQEPELRQNRSDQRHHCWQLMFLTFFNVVGLRTTDCSLCYPNTSRFYSAPNSALPSLQTREY